MPICEFKCGSCGEAFEAIRPVGDSGRDITCPECGARGPERIPSVFAARAGCAPSPTGFS